MTHPHLSAPPLAARLSAVIITALGEPAASALADNIATFDAAAWDVGAHLTCGEVEGLIGILDALGVPDAALGWRDGHFESENNECRGFAPHPVDDTAVELDEDHEQAGTGR